MTATGWIPSFKCNFKENPQERADCSQCVFRATLHVKLSKWKCVLLQIRPRRIRVQASITPQGRFVDLYAFLKKVCTLPRCLTSVSRGGQSGTGEGGQIPPQDSSKGDQLFRAEIFHIVPHYAFLR